MMLRWLLPPVPNPAGACRGARGGAPSARGLEENFGPRTSPGVLSRVVKGDTMHISGACDGVRLRECVILSNTSRE